MSNRRARCWRPYAARCLPTLAVFAAAVADWRVATQADEKIKKASGKGAPRLELVENPDILKTIAGRATGHDARSW